MVSKIIQIWYYLLRQTIIILQIMANKKRQSAAEKAKDRLRSQRYQEEHAMDPEVSR